MTEEELKPIDTSKYKITETGQVMKEDCSLVFKIEKKQENKGSEKGQSLAIKKD